MVPLIAALLLVALPDCLMEDPAGPASQQGPAGGDSLVARIDTTLRIQTVQEGPLTIYAIDRYRTVVVKVPHISSYIFLADPRRSLQQIAADSNYALIVNASYFDYAVSVTPTDTTVRYTHAGYLKINNEVIEQVKDDRQATRLFGYDSRRKIAAYFGVNELDRTAGYDLVVQVGPQIIRANEIDTAGIRASVNGVVAWPRTAFASVNGSELYVIVNVGFAPVTLMDLGAMLRSSGIFRKELNVINFDGGFSTSLYIRNHPELSTNADRKLPILMAVR